MRTPPLKIFNTEYWAFFFKVIPWHRCFLGFFFNPNSNYEQQDIETVHFEENRAERLRLDLEAFSPPHQKDSFFCNFSSG